MKGDTQPTITTEQRRAFADLLKPYGHARERAAAALREAEADLRRSLIEEEAKKCGAVEIAREIVALRTRQADHERTLGGFGFTVDSEDGDIALRYDAPRTLKHAIDGRVRKQLGTERDIERTYDQAMTKVLTANTAEEAARIVESLL